MELTDKQIITLYEIDPTGIKEKDYKAALRREQFRTVLMAKEGMTTEVAQLIAYVANEWEQDGIARSPSTGYLGQCNICKGTSHFDTVSTGKHKGRPKKGKDNTFVWGYQLVSRFVRFTMGGKIYGSDTICSSCYKIVKPIIDEFVKEVDLQADLREVVQGHGYIQDKECKCFKCGELMWESEMGRSQTLFMDGTYPSTCPKCGAVSLPFGQIHKGTLAFRLIKKVGDSYIKGEKRNA